MLGTSRTSPAVHFRGDFSVEVDVLQTAELIAAGKPVAVDNGCVFAIWGDGSSSFAGGVETAKGREPGRTYGLTVSSETFLPLIDFDKIHPDILPLLDDSESFVSRLGAMAFVRAPSRPDILGSHEVPSSVISYPAGTPVVQNWTPEGKTNTEALLQRAGVKFPAVTSLNASGKPEITRPEEADSFTLGKLALLSDDRADRRLQGSFPILELTREGIVLLRARGRSIGSQLLQRLLVGLPLRVPDDAPALSPGLDFPELQGLYGAELRLGMLENVGWSAE